MTAALTLAPALAGVARVYTRLSRDKAEQTSTARQEADCRALAARLGYGAVEVYAEDPGTSGFADVERPARDRMLAELRPGDVVIAWAWDRLTRRGMEDSGRLLRIVEEASARLVTATDGLDTEQDLSELSVGVRAILAREESKKIATRVRSAKALARTSGRWQGGRPPYGLAVVDGRLAPDPATFAIARRIAEEVLAGSTLWAICQRLNAEGVPASRGGSWGLNSVSQLLRAPAFAGLQSYRVRRPDGSWPAVADVYLDPATREPVSLGVGVITSAERSRILALIESRTVESQREQRRGRRVPTSLLGHVGRCEACVGRVAMAGVATARSYRCGTAINGRACPGFSAPEAATDAAISDAFLRRLSRLTPGDALIHEVADRWTAREDRGASLDARRAAVEAVDAIEADIARTRRLVVSGVLDELDAAAEMPRLRALLSTARERLAALPAPDVDVSPLLDLAQSRDAWDALPMVERRALLGLAVAEVRVSKAGRRGLRFVPSERLLIVWQDGSESRPVVA